MSLTVLMIVLTMGAGDGSQPSAAFVETESIADCEERAARVRAIIATTDTPVTESICLPSAQHFEPFMHGDEDDDAPHFSYLIAHDDQQVTVSRVEDCAAVTPAAGEVCAVSLQDMLAE